MKSPFAKLLIACTVMLTACTLPIPSIVPADVQTLPPGNAADDAAPFPDTFGPASMNEKKYLPNVELTSQIIFSVLASEIALQRGEAATAYRTYMSLAHSTRDPRMAQRAAEIALAAQSPEDAQNAAQLWYQYAPDSLRAAQADAGLLVLTGRPDDAKLLLARELSRVKADKRGQAILSLQRLIAHGPDSAGGLNVMKDLLKDDMNLPEAQVAIGRQQLVADDLPGARKSLETALALQPDCLSAAQTLVLMGPQEREKGTLALEKYVRGHPQSRDGHLALAQAYLVNNRLDDAKKQYTVLYKANGNDLEPLVMLALISGQQKKTDEAQRYLTQYVQQAEQTPGVDPIQAYGMLAQIAFSQHRYDAANDWLKRVPPGSSRYFSAQIARAQVLGQQGKVDEARELLASLKATSQSDRALVVHADAEILSRAQRYAEAMTLLAKAVQDFPDDPDLVSDYGIAADESGQYDLMETEARKLMDMQPDNAEGYNLLGYSLAERNVRLPEAEKLLEKAISLAPDNGAIIDSVGWLRYREGKLDEAIKLLRKAYSLYPNAETGAHLGEVLWKSGDEAGARAAWRAALKLKPDDNTLEKTLQRFQIRKGDL